MKPEKKIVATMNTMPATMPTHASTLLSLLVLGSAAGATGAAGAATAVAAGTGGNESVGVSGARVTTVVGGLVGEADLTSASVALVMIGTNDVYVHRGVEGYRSDLRELVRYLTDAGVVPILSTLPDDTAFGGTLAADVPLYNQVIADVAAEYRLPLLNMWRAFTAIPSHGLGSDGLHLASSPNVGGMTPADLQYGQNLRSLITLQTLDCMECGACCRDNDVLLDRDEFPRHKTCGSGLGPRCLDVLKELFQRDEERLS